MSQEDAAGANHLSQSSGASGLETLLAARIGPPFARMGATIRCPCQTSQRTFGLQCLNQEVLTARFFSKPRGVGVSGEQRLLQGKFTVGLQPWQVGFPRSRTLPVL